MPTTSYTTPGWFTYTVPSKVTNVTVTIDGAGSGTRPGGRVGGKILNLTGGQKLYCLVGGAGKIHNGTASGAASTGGGAAGGTGRTSQAGGNGGGGASYIRLGSTTGTIKAVAGGAGGDSGDSGAGGAGGHNISGNGTGGSGGRGTAGTNETGAATGGTQSQGGNGGTSSAGTQYNGHNAVDTVLATGGAGGIAGTTVKSHGGGGGGGGYHPGGGGQASAVGYAPGGGGGGGSSYTAGLSGPTSVQGGGGTGNGSIVITWVDPTAKNQPPTTPSTVKVNNVDAAPAMLTKAISSVKITALLKDPDSGEQIRLLARYSASSTFNPHTDVYSGYVKEKIEDKKPVGGTATVTLTGLKQNTHYYVRLYAQDQHGLYSTGYNTIDFWTNKAPTQPTNMSINGQGEGMTMDTLTSSTFRWVHNDEDIADYQSAFELKYRTAATSIAAAGPWTVVTKTVGQNLPPKVPGPPSSAANEWVFDPGTFKGNKFYEWTVRTRDTAGSLWGAQSTLFTFHVSSTSAPPTLLAPTNRGAVDVNKPTTFTWRFVDPDIGAVQVKADLRYRAVAATKDLHGMAPTGNDNADNWVTLLGAASPGVPGATKTWTLPANTFSPLYTYEWEVRTYDIVGGPPSDWSDPFFLYAIATPGSEGGALPIADNARIQGSLGCGSYRVFLYEQGGQKLLGEITPVSTLTFTRLRDDISSCLLHTNGYSEDCGQLYAKARSWMHEIVVFRDNVRVWEGPITRIAYTKDDVEFEAKDVMAYVYRRVMRQGYNDQYRLIKKGTGGAPDEYLGLLSVVRRAAMLITQGLAPFDPNVLPDLTALEYNNDAKESRFVADWSRTIWEEVDDLAATAGLDYTTVGRRILLWDTHRAIGRLPEMRDGDFSESPIVTEYGMQLANFMGVTNGSGVVGYTWQGASTYPFGPIEMLASSYSDAASSDLQTPEQLKQATDALIEQAKRNIAHRFPAPVIVRIPDNSTLSPNANVGFQQLIPGVWLPLRSVSTPRKVLQWQKLDSVSVEVDDKGEKVHVVVSPAPNGGNDPDADTAAEADD